MEDERPISYLALAVGTPVLSSSETSFGRVEHVLQIPELDLFDGIVVATHHRHDLRFVDRDQIREITTAAVRCSISDDEVDSLPAPVRTIAVRPNVDIDEGRSLTAWYGRTFGRQHWKDLD